VRDRVVNAGLTFERTTSYSDAEYSDSCRARTYACSFSLENIPLIWERYGLGDPVGMVGVVFNFGKLREMLNSIIGNEPGRSALMVGNVRCERVCYINHGLIGYVDARTVQMNKDVLPNPIIYSYLKDAAQFAGEKVLRVMLSTLGVGRFALADGSEIVFPPSMRLDFDFQAALGNGTIARHSMRQQTSFAVNTPMNRRSMRATNSRTFPPFDPSTFSVVIGSSIATLGSGWCFPAHCG
jgi:hypothetical protein